MTVRTTSITAYQNLVERGALSPRRREVYEALWKHGPLAEAAVAVLLERGRESVAPRFSELERMGVIRSVGTVVNDNGNHVHLWDVTEAEVAQTLARPPSRYVRLRRLVKEAAGYLAGLPNPWGPRVAERLLARMSEIHSEPCEGGTTDDDRTDNRSSAQE